MDPINDGEEYSMYGMFAEVWFELQVSYQKLSKFFNGFLCNIGKYFF